MNLPFDFNNHIINNKNAFLLIKVALIDIQRLVK